jgi:Chaperone of endosialidase
VVRNLGRTASPGRTLTSLCSPPLVGEWPSPFARSFRIVDGPATISVATWAYSHAAQLGAGAWVTAVGDSSLYSNTVGASNTAVGAAALSQNTTGVNNTAVGDSAMFENIAGSNNAAFGDVALDSSKSDGNSAFGSNALALSTTGSFNVALGELAMFSNTTGDNNTAVGTEALSSNTTGVENNVSGVLALQANTTGSRNNAAGAYAMYSNTTSSDNNAMGYKAMYGNTTGTLNNAVGNFSLIANTTGSNNSAVGYAALYRNTTGSNNNAQGFYALQSNTTGNNNIAIGPYAGNYITGSNNIDIGNRGVAADSAVIRIGASNTAAYIAGITNSQITGAPVYVSASGQLGVLASSERYKTSIAIMGAGTERLKELRPVTFHLKSSPHGALQYGLIAEEVAKVYPELVIKDDAGSIQGVRYDELAPMLLNEMQHQQQNIAAQAAELRGMQQQIAALKESNVAMQAALMKLTTKDERIASR